MRPWAKVTLESVTAGGTEGLRRGPFGGAIKKEIFIPDGYRIYEQKHAIYGDFDAGEYFIGEHRYRKLKTFAVQSGDMLVSCSGTLGRVAIVPPTAKPGIINQALLRIRPKLDVVSPVFFKMLLETPELQASLFGSAGGSAIKNVRPLSAIRKVEFGLPPLAEQRRIAEVLERAEALRAKRRAALAQLDSLTQSLFLDLFGDPVTNPKGWKTASFGSQIKGVRYGTGSPPIYAEEGFPFIRATNVKGGTVVRTGLKFISSGEAEKIKKCKISAGDLIVVRSGVNAGDCALIPEEFDGSYAGYDLIVELDHVPAVFYNFFINSNYGKQMMDRLTRRAAQPHLNADQLRGLTTIVPPIPLQREFARRVTAVEALKTAQSASLAELDALFATLQHRAFRGEL